MFTVSWSKLFFIIVALSCTHFFILLKLFCRASNTKHTQRDTTTTLTQFFPEYYERCIGTINIVCA